jgi:hypothetical protein
VRKRSRGEWGGDRGVRGSARSGVRGRKTPRANPVGPPKRIGRRETPGPPVLWPWVQAQGQGRSASFEEMPESDEARVLVVEVVGSRSRLVRIEVELHGASQGKPSEGDLVRSKPSKPLTRATAARLSTRRAATGGAVGRASVRALRIRRRVKPARVAKRCAGTTPNRHRQGMVRGSVGCRKVSGPDGWNAALDERKLAE